MLRHLKEQQKLGWKEIAAHFPNRTTNACQFRWRRLMSGTLRSSSGGASSANTAVSTSSPISSAHHLHRHTASASTTPSPTTDAAMFRTAYPEPGTRNWSRDEDELILARSDLRVEELSLLLPQRNETEIWHRRVELINLMRGGTHHHSASGLSNNYAVSHSQQYSSARRSSVDPVTLLPPVVNQQMGVPAVPPPPIHHTLQPPRLYSKKNSASPFEGLRLPPPVSQTRRPPHQQSPSSSASMFKGY